MKEFIKQLIEQAKVQGADAADVYASQYKGVSISVFGGEIEECKHEAYAGAGIRVIQDSRVGYAYTEALEDAEELVKSALENAQITDEDPDSTIYHSQEVFEGEITQSIGATDEQIVQKAMALYEATMAQEYVTSTQGIDVQGAVSSSVVANTDGLYKSSERRGFVAMAQPVVQKGEYTESGWAFACAASLDQIDVDKLAKQAQQRGMEFYQAQRSKNGNLPVILHAEAMADLLDAFSPIFFAEQAQKGLSLLKGKQGEKIADEKITLIDDPYYPTYGYTRPFDGEGLPTRRTAVIDKGVLKTLLYNLKSAKKDGVESTANAARGYQSKVGTSPMCFAIQAGDASLEEMIARAKDGVLVKSVSGLHAGVNAVSGEFSLLAKGHRIENGKITAPLEQMVVSGNLFQMLKGVEMVGNDTFYGYPAGALFASPSLLIKALSIAGS